VASSAGYKGKNVWVAGKPTWMRVGRIPNGLKKKIIGEED